MQYRGTAFEDYVLDQFIKVQLLFDESFKYVQVSQISDIPKSPIVANTSRTMFHKSTSIMKYMVQYLEELSNFQYFPLNPQFQKNIIKFYSIHKANFKSFTIEALIESFQDFLLKQPKISKSNSLYYIQTVQLVDVLLVCKSTSGEKSQLLAHREKLLACVYLQLPTISDEKLRQSICDSFEITPDILESKISQINTVVSKTQVVNFFKSSPKLLSNFYQQDAFEEVEYYRSWLMKSQNLENDMINLFMDPMDNSTSMFSIPNQIQDTVALLAEIALDSSSKFFQGLIQCMQIWQVNPFHIQTAFIQVAANIKKDGRINPELVEKAFNLSYLAMPFQIQFLEWPYEEKKKFLQMSLQIYNDSIEDLKPFFGMFFVDQTNFTVVLSFLKLLKLNLKDVKLEIKKQLVSSADQRLRLHRERSKLNEIDRTLRLQNLVKYLSYVSSDVNLLYNWKTNNKDLNMSFQIFENGSKILMSPSLELIKRYVSEIRSQSFNLMSDKSSKANFGTFIDLVNNLKARTNFKYDFQKEIYGDFYKIVGSWKTEILQKTKVIIANDNLVRLDGCAHSSSIQNLVMLFQGYIKLLESFKWQDGQQSAELNIQLYKSMMSSVKFYHSSMLKKMYELIKSDNTNERTDYFVCLNNIQQLFDYLESLESKKEVLQISEYLNRLGQVKNKSSTKYVSILIKNAENIEDSKGSPISTKVRLSGLVNDETRVIVKDYNPDWMEEFNIVTELKGTANVKIEIINMETGNLYKAIEYKVQLGSETSFRQQNERLSLKSKSGTLNICVNVEFEKNDPLFYIINCKNEVGNSLKRTISYFVERYSLEFKSIFTIPYLQQSIIDNPVRAENNYKKLQDPHIDSIVGNFQVHIIPLIYNNLVTKLFDTMVVEFWKKILSIAENLLLPRISIINYTINNKLAKRSSTLPSMVDSKMTMSMSNVTARTIHPITREELIRVVEWCFKFRAMIDIPDMIVQDDTLNKPFKEFNSIKQLFNEDNKQLHRFYYKDWSYISKHMLSRLNKSAKFNRTSWTAATRHKEIVCRVLLARGEIKFVKTVIELEKRFEKIIKTEIQVVNIQQFL